jgi:cell division protein ZapA (FtsZ GTPase activity inhibitor)
MKSNVTVVLAGQKLTIVTTEEEEYVQAIAERVQVKLDELSNQGMARAALLVALNCTDLQTKADEEVQRLKSQILELSEEQTRLKTNLNDARREITRLRTLS